MTEVVILALLAEAIGIYAVLMWMDYDEALEELKGKGDGK